MSYELLILSYNNPYVLTAEKSATDLLIIQ